MNKPEALRLADELEAPVGTQSTYSAMQQAAAELRRLHADAERYRYLRAALAQQDEPCPNCASLEAQNTELDQKLAELEQAYQSGYNAGVAAERETIIQAMPGGHSVDPQWVCDMIRSRGNT